MKKFIALLLALSVLAPVSAFAENDGTIVLEPPAEEIMIEPTMEPAGEIVAEEAAMNPILVSDAVGVDIYISDHQVVVDSVAHFNLFDSEGNLVGTDEQWIGANTKYVRLQFSVPAYEVGEVFTLGFVDGFRNMQYYSDVKAPGSVFELQTYAMLDEAGNIIHGNNFAFNAEPNFEQGLNFYYDTKPVYLYPRGRFVDGIAMMPAEAVGEAMGVDVNYDARYNSVTFLDYDQIIFNIDTTYATFFGRDLRVSHAPVWIDGSIYVPINDLLNALGCRIDSWQDEDHVDIIASKSAKIEEYKRNSERVNKEGIDSRTDYLVWVSKSDFTVKLYLGEQYNWECIMTAPCTIGKPSTPTIEGEFEYKYNAGVWDYGKYYVSPALVFYGGYALHSTLRASGGGMYDDRVGEMLSLGCVRLHPADIEKIHSLIPVGTKIYITP